MLVSDLPNHEGMTIALIGGGLTLYQFLQNYGHPEQRARYDQVWAVNHTGMLVHPVDLVFHIDDLIADQPIMQPLLDRGVPVVTSDPYDWPQCIAYPREEVWNAGCLGVVPNNVLTYAIGFATWRRVAEMHLFGCDFYAGGAHAMWTPGEANAAFALGIASGKGMKIAVVPGSAFLGMNEPRVWYGYKKKPTPMGERITILKEVA